VHNLVTVPAEQVVSQVTGIEHVYSVTQPGMAVLTVQFKVGQPRIDSLVKLHDTLLSNRDWLPTHLGVHEPVVKPKGIDDVPIVALTLTSTRDDMGASDLQKVAHALEIELKRVAGHARGDHAWRAGRGRPRDARSRADERAPRHGDRHRARAEGDQHVDAGRRPDERQPHDRSPHRGSSSPMPTTSGS